MKKWDSSYSNHSFMSIHQDKSPKKITDNISLNSIKESDFNQPTSLLVDYRESNVAQLQKIANQSPQVEKTTQLQAMANQFNEQKKVPNNTPQYVVQRKIHVKGGKKYNRVEPTVVAPKLTALATSPNIYYVRSAEDIGKMKASEDVPVLANKKHLIGERHNESSFNTAVANWGWAAGMLIEEYSTHKKLKSPKQTKKEGTDTTEGTYDQNFVHANAKALEDTAAKGLTLAVNGQIFGAQVLRFATAIQSPETFSQTNKAQLKDACATAWHKCSPLMDLTLTLASYLAKSAQSTFFHDKKHDLVRSVITAPLIGAVGAGLDNMREQLLDENSVHLDVDIIQNFIDKADQLVPVLQELIVAYDNKDFSLQNIRQMTTAAQPGGNTEHGNVGALDPLREKYMIKNINAAKVPTLVKIGRQHVGHMEDAPPAHSITYNDYTNFEAKNTANNVD